MYHGEPALPPQNDLELSGGPPSARVIGSAGFTPKGLYKKSAILVLEGLVTMMFFLILDVAPRVAYV